LEEAVGLKLSGRILALDLDHTLTKGGEDRLSSTLRSMLEKLKKEGWVLVLVTGRDRNYIQGREDLTSLFDAWVLENGVEVYLPGKGTSKVYLPIGWENLRRQVSGFPSVSVKLWTFSLLEEDVEKVRDVAKQLGISVVFKDNKGLLHALPEGVHKGTGFRKALELLDVDGWKVVVGDAFIDLNLFQEADFRVAVDNAEEPLKKIADYVTEKPNGRGVEEFLQKLLTGNLPSFKG